MITITSQPPNIDTDTDPKEQPVPLSDCLQWCLQPASGDVITTPGAAASVTIEWPNVPTVPADGTTFTLWGRTFTVDSAQAYTSMSFQITTTGLQTARNMVNMLRANLFFRRATTAQTSGPDNQDVLIGWTDCREQDNFGDDAMDMTALETAGATVTVTNGTSPVYVDGYKIVFRLLKYDAQADDFLPVTQFEGADPNRGCSTVEEMCINMVRDAAGLLYTQMPDLETEGEPDPLLDSVLGRFRLEYGWTYRNGNCEPQSGTFMQSGQVLVLNAAFEPRETYGVRRYWKGATGGFPSGQTVPDFLTTQPKKLSVCTDSFAWLWLLNSFTDAYPDIGSLKLVFTVYKKGTPGVFGTYEAIYPTVEWYQAYIFNVSVGRVLENVVGIDEDTLDRYDVKAVLLDGGDDVIADASETLTFVVSAMCCEESTDVYFLTPAGGIGTMLCRVEDITMSQEGERIFSEVPCNTVGDYQTVKAKYGGLSPAGVQAFESLTISAVENYSPDQVNYFRQFVASPQKWIRIATADGGFMAHKFIVEASEVSIFKAGDKVTLTAKGRLQDSPVQMPNEIEL